MVSCFILQIYIQNVKCLPVVGQKIDMKIFPIFKGWDQKCLFLPKEKCFLQTSIIKYPWLSMLPVVNYALHANTNYYVYYCYDIRVSNSSFNSIFSYVNIYSEYSILLSKTSQISSCIYFNYTLPCIMQIYMKN